MPHVTIPDENPIVQYVVGGTPDDSFTFDFTFFANSDIKVYVGSSLLSSSDYTVAGNAGTDGGYDGGNVTLDTPVSNTNVTILRDVPIERTTDFPTSGPFNITALNTQFDKLFAIGQQQSRLIGRAIKIPDTDSTALDTEIPVAATRANKILAFDSSGNVTVSNQTLATLESAGDSATAAAASASSASTSATNAANSATAAAASYDSFDDRYLGAKASDPSLDNDGNALITGAFYWNTGSNIFRVWSGSAWTTFTVPADDDVTNAKLANMANARIKARATSGTGDPEDCTLSQVLDFIGSPARGDILYRGSSSWSKLSASGADGKVLSSQGTSGDPTWIDRGRVVQTAYAEYTSATSITASIPIDDTIPQNNEGTQILSVSITPKSTTNKLRISFYGWGSTDNNNAVIAAAIFVSGNSSALSSSFSVVNVVNFARHMAAFHEYIPGVVSSLTFSVRVGVTAGSNLLMNGYNGSRLFGGSSKAVLIIEEITP